MEKKDWYIIAGFLGVALLYKKIVKPKNKNKESKSSFIGSAFGKRVMFTLSNKTNSNQVVPIFNSYSNIQNPNVSITPSMAEFNRTLLNEPKKIVAIEVRASGNKKQAEMPIQIQCKDASGEFKSSYLYPLVSAFQVAQDTTTVQPSNLIANGECYLNLTVLPNQSFVLIVHYDVADSSEKKKINCRNCSWSWNEEDGGKDKYVCHKCNTDNEKYYKNKSDNKSIQSKTGTSKKIKVNPYLVGGVGALGLLYFMNRK
jgi:hypothetical protein